MVRNVDTTRGAGRMYFLLSFRVHPALKDGKTRPVASVKLEGVLMYSDGVTSKVK